MTKVPEIVPLDALARLHAEDAVFVDVRDRGSFERGHIPGAVHLDDDNVGEFVETAERGRAVIVYCYHGHSSLGGAAYFLEQGFEEVYSLRGGFAAWGPESPSEHLEAAASAPSLPTLHASDRVAHDRPAVPSLDSEAAFDAAIAQGLSLVDFWAAWCGPCRAMAPNVEKVAEQLHGGLVSFYKVDTDALAGLSKRLRIRTIPTVLLFRDGKEVARLMGYQDRKALRAAAMDLAGQEEGGLGRRVLSKVKGRLKGGVRRLVR